MTTKPQKRNRQFAVIQRLVIWAGLAAGLWGLFGADVLSLTGAWASDTAPAATAAAADTSHAAAGGGHASHGDPYAKLFQVFGFIIVCALVGRWLARRLHQPAVLGELLIGMALGTVLYQFQAPAVAIIRHHEEVVSALQQVLQNDLSWSAAIQTVGQDTTITPEVRTLLVQVMGSPAFPDYYMLARSAMLLSSLGVILLLFMVGLEVSLDDMRRVGSSALGVAILGTVVPFGLGFASVYVLVPDATFNMALFLGASLAATSIGITARVFKDLHKMHLTEAKIVLGAAVLDDVLGLIVLAVVSGIVSSGVFEAGTAGLILLKAVLFIGLTLWFGKRLLGRNILFFARLDGSSIRLLYPIVLMLMLAWLADFIGLATIVGAFCAGLILNDDLFDDLPGEKPKALSTSAEHGHSLGRQSLEALIGPIEGIFAPVFFVLMGMQVDVATFTDTSVLLLALALTAVAILGKLAAALLLPKGIDKLIVGIGMVPRGEVGLIFAGIGKGLGVLDAGTFSALIILVILTTLVTPPLLKWAIDRHSRLQHKAENAQKAKPVPATAD